MSDAIGYGQEWQEVLQLAHCCSRPVGCDDKGNTLLVLYL